MRPKGLTLVELLVSMTIIAVLASLALVSLQGARRSARDGQRKADLEEIRSALEMYRTDGGEYPATLPTLTPEYLELHSDPISGQSYSYYQVSESAYNLCAGLEVDTGDDFSSDCPSGCGAEVTCNYKVSNP